MTIGPAGDNHRQGGLAGARGTPQDDRRKPISFNEGSQRCARAQQVPLADNVLECAGPHPGGQGGARSEARLYRGFIEGIGQPGLRVVARRHPKQGTGDRCQASTRTGAL